MEMSPLRRSIAPESIEAYIEQGAAPGCQIAFRSPDEQGSFAVGRFADENSKAVTDNTAYDVASITKLFTTALILRLHEQGKLSIDDLCANYLDNFHNSTVRLVDLLTHRVDFGIYLSEYRDKHPDAAGLRDALMHIQPPAYVAPRIHYGNLEFFYLGKIIEDQTSNSLQSNLHALFQDLGLKHTYTGLDVTNRHMHTPPTERIDGMTVENTTHDETARMLGGLAGNAGVFSTAEDLVAFGQAWLDGRIIQSDMLRQRVFSDQDESGRKPQGIGWWMRYGAPTGEQPTPGVFSHTGYTGSILIVNPGNDKVATLTCNRTYYSRDNTEQRQIWQHLMEWVQ